MGKYDHLPIHTAAILSDWEYKGARPTVNNAGSVAPTVAFSTVDVKLPRTGTTKILEINGFESGLDAYGEERREDSIIERANLVTNSLDVPIARYRWNGEGKGYREIRRDKIPHYAADVRKLARLRVGAIDELGDPFTIHSDLTGFQSDAVKAWLENRRATAQIGAPEIQTRLAAIEDSPLLIELTDPNMPAWSNFDPEDALIANPAEIRYLEENKIAFSSVASLLGLNDYRPRSSMFLPNMPSVLMQDDLREQDDIKKIVLKYPDVEVGRGVTVLSKEEFTTLTNLAGRIGTWGVMLDQLGGDGVTSKTEAYRRSSGQGNGPMDQLLLEEYVPSKPIKAPDGKKFDATMRLVISSLANRGKVTIVPLGAYWKLPRGEIGNGEDSDHEVSRIEYGKGSLPVSNADFKRAFKDVSHFMGWVITNVRSTAGSPEWSAFRYVMASV